MSTFAEFATRLLKQEGESLPQGTLLSFDPGHTTGWCVFNGLEYRTSGEIATSKKTIDNILVGEITELFDAHGTIDAVVIEDYRVYSWKRDQHVGSDMLTTRIIGMIETIATMRMIEVIAKQPAQVAKMFCTDNKLKSWGLWQKGQRHARDSIRHACYFQLFGGKDKWLARQRKGKSNNTVG